MAFLPGSDASTSQTVSQVPQLMQASVTMLGRRRTLTSKSPGCPLTASTVARRRMVRLGWSMETLRWKHLRVPAWASPAGRHWPQSLVGNTVPMRAARPPRKGRRSMSSTGCPILASSAAACVPATPPPMTTTVSWRSA